MTKDEFLKKHNLTEADYRNLQRFEEVRVSASGIFDVLYHFELMKKHNLNGGEKMVDFIKKDDNYEDFLETLAFEVIQELKNKVSALEEENKLLKEFVYEVEFNILASESAVCRTKKEEKFKNIDWSY